MYHGEPRRAEPNITTGVNRRILFLSSEEAETNFEKTAREEGFEEVAESFEEIAEVEEKHEIRYRKLLDNVENGTVFKRDTEVMWKCRNCGYVHTGKEAPEICPACKHVQSYYELFVEPY